MRGKLEEAEGKKGEHLGEDVANDAALVVLGDLGDAGPRAEVVDVVTHLVVLGQALQVGRLHLNQIANLGGKV